MKMNLGNIYCAGGTQASRIARKILTDAGLPVAHAPKPDVEHLLLDVPSFSPSGSLRTGGNVKELLQQLPKDCIIYGGNLSHPALQEYRTVDFLKMESYLAENAYITAECALDVALPYLTVTLRNCPVLVIGWGRIGKCLGKILKALEADVTISARKSADLALICALGYHAVHTGAVQETIGQYRLIFNTVPSPVLTKADLERCRNDCIKIELASTDGMVGEDIIIARGLPGVHLPESSGRLIAKTFLQSYKEEAI